MANQFVIEVDDRPGSLSRLFHVLALAGISIHHTAGVSGNTRGLVVLSLSDPARAREALQAEGYTFSEGESLVLRVEDRPGALAEVTEVLAKAGVNVTSVLEVGCHSGWADHAFTVDDIERAQAAIAGSGVMAVDWRDR